MGQEQPRDKAYHKGRLVAIRAIETETLSDMHKLDNDMSQSRARPLRTSVSWDIN